METELRASETRFRSFFDNAPIGKCITSPTGTLLRVNPAFATMLGYTTDELTGRPFATLTHPDDAAQSLEGSRRLLAGEAESLQFEKRYRTRQGRDVWAQVTTRLQRDDAGRPLHFLTHVLDIDERNRARAALRESEAQALLRTRALEATAHAVVITDVAGTILWINPAFTRLTGFAPAEVIGENPRILSSGQNERHCYTALWETILSGEVWSGELINRRKDGTLYTEEMTITPVRSDAGSITHFVAVKQDVTSRRAAEAALRTSEQRYRTLADAAHDEIFIVDQSGLLVYANTSAALRLGLTADQVAGKSLGDVFPPEVAAGFTLRIQETLAANEHVYAEHEIASPGGTRWMGVWLAPLAEDGNSATRVMGVARDITDRKRNEAALSQAQRLVEHVVASSPRCSTRCAWTAARWSRPG
jgi:PAS domain S-box-containing protein